MDLMAGAMLNLPPCNMDSEGICTMEPVDDTHGPGQCVCWGKGEMSGRLWGNSAVFCSGRAAIAWQIDTLRGYVSLVLTRAAHRFSPFRSTTVRSGQQQVPMSEELHSGCVVAQRGLAGHISHLSGNGQLRLQHHTVRESRLVCRIRLPIHTRHTV